MVAAVKGYRLILTMPEDMSVERRQLFARYGAEVVLTAAIEGMGGAVFAAEEIAKQPGHFLPQQFENPANPAVHRRTTAAEIWEATEGRLDAFVAGVGTGGTITGVGEVLKARRPDLLVAAVEPERSPVLRGGRFGLHGIQGIGASFVPGVLNREVYDEVIGVSDEDAYAMMARLAREEGMLAGVSAGANVLAACRVAEPVGDGAAGRHDHPGHRRALSQRESAGGAGAPQPPWGACRQQRRRRIMTVKVYVPTPFRSLTANRAFVDADGADVAGVLRDLEQHFPGFREKLFDADQRILEHINIYVNNQEISALAGPETPVADGDEVAVVPAIAGGAALTPDQVDRYSRHLIMEQVGPLGQRKLLAGKVLVVGAGRLGLRRCWCTWPRRAWGTLGIVDFDVVDLSNLQRQIIHATSDLGRPKVESARRPDRGPQPERDRWSSTPSR